MFMVQKTKPFEIKFMKSIFSAMFLKFQHFTHIIN